MSHALFEILDGRYDDGAPLGSPHEASATVRSIRDHLSRLLNARRGVLRHLPDYGMPDLPSIYEGLPYSLEDLALSVQQLITKYEPRLAYVQVQVRPHENKDCVVQLEVVGRLRDGALAQFKTSFHSGGLARVQSPHIGGRHA